MTTDTSSSTPPGSTATASDPADTARQALVEAAREQGIDPANAQILQDARNWVFRLPRGGVVGKVHSRAAHYADVARQARTATALLAAGLPTAAPVGRIAMARGHLVSFTEDLGPHQPGERQFGELLARLHRLPPTGFDVAPVDKVARAFDRLARLRPTAISDADRDRLHRLLEDAADAYRQAAWPKPCLTHGDITLANSALTGRGAALLDLETLGVGHPCFDQAAPRFAVDAFGKDPAAYEAWAAGYGYDLAAADPRRYELLVPFLGAASCLFYLDWADRSRPEARPEAELRLATLLERRPFPWGWAPVYVAGNPAADHQPRGLHRTAGGPGTALSVPHAKVPVPVGNTVANMTS
ncbi:aminoglycoside phosphotransferase family protein [Kitasatospora sp. YST-16]|uniref:phosphotransferase family protein n=1 Tax=Kitasatospora sp. YST-16 TaxID=2998080 RepID=UPI002283DF35|nr:aminoglycoside phosphotransferase family protein [Kitasatospora sp. YST-16]WAL74524.1 aminoglycoside phosphotransferase family protein [Kitasatospora sp. YST-16]WNW40585.1 aminoglycoside phosphotransferase family protein [Streptomyces sp. Li-HN-5-13]